MVSLFHLYFSYQKAITFYYKHIVISIVSENLLFWIRATHSTNQMQDQDQSQLGRMRFSAIGILFCFTLNWKQLCGFFFRQCEFQW